LVSILDGYGGIDWESWLAATPLWITETNCNHDYPSPATNVEACQRMTGQAGHQFAPGSPATWESLDNVDRLAWWMVTSNNPS